MSTFFRSYFSNCLFVYSQFGVGTADYYLVIGWAFGGRDPENGAGGRAARAERPGEESSDRHTEQRGYIHLRLRPPWQSCEMPWLGRARTRSRPSWTPPTRLSPRSVSIWPVVLPAEVRAVLRAGPPRPRK